MRKTLHLRAENPADVRRAAELLRDGRLVAFPTETVYGLGANALLPWSVEGIFVAKGRPSWDPLIVHLAEPQRLAEVARVEGDLAERVRALAGAFWPGPMTLLLPRTEAIPDLVTAGRALVGCRVPGHAVAQSVLRLAGVPVAAPSANRFGHISPTTAEHVLDDLAGRIDAVLDGGPCPVGVESTVLDPGVTPMVLYRAGAVSPEAIRSATGVAVVNFTEGRDDERQTAPASLPSPGVGLRHYAPDVVVQLTEGSPGALWAAARVLAQRGMRPGVLLPRSWPVYEGEATVVRWGEWNDAASLAAGLFAGLRELEQKGVQTIVCPLPDPGGLRDALRDRLGKAAKPRDVQPGEADARAAKA